MITFSGKGNFDNSSKWLNKIKDPFRQRLLDKYGQMGVDALKANTPTRTGKTASSWGYVISSTDTGHSIQFTNDNINKNVNIAIILQYGHGTGTGGWVEGIDYINPAIQPVFEKMANDLWKEVLSL